MKKKCLIIIPGIPYPPVDGHKLKIYNFILILSKYFDLHIITISKENLSVDQENFIKRNSYQSKHFRIGILGTLFRLFKSVFSKIPFQVGYFTLSTVKKYISINAENDHYAVLNLIRTGEYRNLLLNKYIILDMVDSLSKSYLKSNETTTSIVYKFIYGIEGHRLVAYEKKCISSVDLTLCVNNEDASNLSSYGKVKWLPNGVNPSLFIYQKKSNEFSNHIVFFGTMFYQPNIDAIIWFEKYVLDHLNPEIKLIIIGARPSSSILSLAKKRRNITVTGFLDDPYFIINSCFAVIAPMQNGGGIQNKILETMAMGKINVLTSYAADPIVDAIDNKHFIVENDPVIMAKKINDVYNSPFLFLKMEQNAKNLIKEKYTWEAYEEGIVSEINRNE